MNKLEQLQWPLIIGMGALALVRPFLNSIGAIDSPGTLISPFMLTVFISATWLVIVVRSKVHAPLLTLLFAGAAYGVFTLLISAFLSTVLGGQLGGPLTNSFATLFVLVTHTFWGFVVGLMARVLLGTQNAAKTQSRQL